MIKYDVDYYQIQILKTYKTADIIYPIRWDFIKDVPARSILDYGSGVGWFRAFKPDWVKAHVDSYDIGGYAQTGITQDRYDLVCFWDVLEHIPDLDEVKDIIENANYIALAIPIKPDDQPWKTWKHFRPKEHFHYFDKEMLDATMSIFGFKKIKEGTPECPPREDVYSFIYSKT